MRGFTAQDEEKLSNHMRTLASNGFSYDEVMKEIEELKKGFIRNPAKARAELDERVKAWEKK